MAIITHAIANIYPYLSPEVPNKLCIYNDCDELTMKTATPIHISESNRGLRVGSVINFLIVLRGLRWITLWWSRSSLLVLWNASNTNNNCAAAKNHPKINIASTPRWPKITLPKNGQRINQIPNNAHISPKFFLFSSGVGEISVRIACIIEIFHHVTPLIALAIRKTI